MSAMVLTSDSRESARTGCWDHVSLGGETHAHVMHAGEETGKTYVDFNGIRPAISLDFNASLTFNRLVIDRGGNYTDLPPAVDVPAFIPEIITRGTIVVFPGASVRMVLN